MVNHENLAIVYSQIKISVLAHLRISLTLVKASMFESLTLVMVIMFEITCTGNSKGVRIR